MPSIIPEVEIEIWRAPRLNPSLSLRILMAESTSS